MRNDALQAVLWLEDGIMLRDDIAVPNSPPPRYCIALMTPFRVIDGYEPTVTIQQAEFRLEREVKGGERVHYFLDTRPPDGYRWMVCGKTIWTEKIDDMEFEQRAKRRAERLGKLPSIDNG